MSRCLVLLIGMGCVVEPTSEEPSVVTTEDGEVIEVTRSSDEVYIDYSSVCFFTDSDGCKQSDGTRVGDFRLNCGNAAVPDDCILEELVVLGDDRWQVHLGSDGYPEPHTLYLLSRPRL